MDSSRPGAPGLAVFETWASSLWTHVDSVNLRRRAPTVIRTWVTLIDRRRPGSRTPRDPGHPASCANRHSNTADVDGSSQARVSNPARPGAPGQLRGTILLRMICLPKPRSFWDYALFALFMTGLLLLVFWSDSTNRIGWADVVFALAAAILSALGVVLARRRERAAWIKRPIWQASFIVCIAAFALLSVAEYGDGYLLHHTTITAHQLRHDFIFGLFLSAGLTWLWRRRSRRNSQLL